MCLDVATIYEMLHFFHRTPQYTMFALTINFSIELKTFNEHMLAFYRN